MNPYRIVKQNKRYIGTMPYSEVCMHMQIAGQKMAFELTPNNRAVQLYTLDGKEFSFPILTCEAGVFNDGVILYGYGLTNAN